MDGEDVSVPMAVLPLLGVGIFTLLLTICFCLYLWRLRLQGEAELGYTQSKYKKKKGEKEHCPVCLDEFKVNIKIGVCRCGHFFHVKCLQQWLHEHNNCPMCKAVVGVSENTRLVANAVAIPPPPPPPTALSNSV